MPSVSGSYSRLADEIRMNFKSLNLLQVKYLDFYLVNVTAIGAGTS